MNSIPQKTEIVVRAFFYCTEHIDTWAIVFSSIPFVSTFLKNLPDKNFKFFEYISKLMNAFKSKFIIDSVFTILLFLLYITSAGLYVATSQDISYEDQIQKSKTAYANPLFLEHERELDNKFHRILENGNYIEIEWETALTPSDPIEKKKLKDEAFPHIEGWLADTYSYLKANDQETARKFPSYITNGPEDIRSLHRGIKIIRNKIEELEK